MPVPSEPNHLDSSQSGLPKISPDFIEQDFPADIDNIVPTRGYQMLPVVALGGSAGSIPALQQFFESMLPTSGLAFVVILHLSAEYESTLPEVLGRWTKMPVVQAHDAMKLEPDTVYVIPPGKHLLSVEGFLRLTDLEPERGKRVAVDLFFRSLADTHGPHALAVVLSGADGDGAIGIKRVKERGGLTIAQDPDEAEHDGMPRSAIATGMVDWVLGVREMPARLLDYTARERRLRVPSEDGPQPAKAPPTADDESEAALREVLSFLRMRTGRDFSYYKRATIVRRIARRLQINELDNVPAYLDFLRTHPGESGALLQDLLISVTNFFRDRDSFDALQHHLPELFRNKGSGDTVRVWVPACATGEEAYSIAMMLFEHARTLENAPSIQVFGCDLDESAIQMARAGVYQATISADVSEERLQRFFVREPRGYRIRRELREAVLFAPHDLLKDAPFSRMDMITCRNLLIYLNRDAQARALEIFHFALRQNGILFLGSSESIDENHQLFSVLDKKHRIYLHKTAPRITLPVPIGPSTLLRAVQARQAPPVLPGMAFSHSPGAVPFPAPIPSIQDGISLQELHFKLIERLAPPSIIVNPQNEIVHLSQSAGKYLQFSGGEPTMNLLRVVHPSLRIELRAALFQAAEKGAPVDIFNLQMDLDGEPRTIDVRVSPAKELAPGFMLVVFEARPQKPDQQREPRRADSEPIVLHLERELEHVKGQLREVVEQYEANTEELKASNEELQAMNEELRSTTEELETSREELQSINEELSTVNQELKSKVDELGHANGDLKNLMASTAIATIFIDREFRILRYTPPAVDLFHVIPGDIGRPLKDLRDRLSYPELISDAEQVLQKLIPVEREVGDQEGRWYLARLLPYRTDEDRIAGVVLTFVDISRRKEAEEALRASEERYRRLFNSIDEGFCVIEVIFNARQEPVDYRLVEVNPSFEKHTGLQNALGRTINEMVPQQEPYWFEIYGHVAISGQSVRFERRAEKLGRWYDVYAFRCSEPEHQVAVLFTDITRKKLSEQALLASQERLRLVVENAREFAIFSTDLERNVTSWNTGAERLLGFTENEIVGRSGDMIFTDEDRAAGAPQEEADRAQRDGKAVDERWHMRKDRSRFWGSGYLMMMRDNEGKVFGFVKILHDRTEAKRAEEELAESRARLEIALKEAEHARQEAEAAGRTKDHFLATLSHELRTPLTPVMMTAESLLKRKDLPPRALDGLALICRNIEIQTHFIDDLLDVTRIARGKFELLREPVNVHDALRGAVEVCAADISTKAQQLILELAATEQQILGDAARVQQVFWNLLKNASKFTPDGGRITVQSRNDGGNIFVTVSDTGMGIDPTRLIDIFEAFKQGDTSITRRFGGLGLGLAISKATVEALGGRITAESAGAGKGSTFVVRLPLAAAL